ncbi:hypothetical protein BDU57DRAFT_467321 [Ampelomyces quisqualis]|uniref:Uncharacterized protein n=1 Tax=Ampelomyces quisqualis TaxID=50730 RepID=A0A6A5R6Y3_AMPQU|nr:hypothetical protein BDU57DRAFT_467321 [Ampelomyces quisqualis]
MEEGRFPYGYTHGEKRSYAQADGSESSASPVWNARDAAGGPSVHLHPHPFYVHDNRPQVNENLRFHLRQINNPYSPSYPPTERPASAGVVHPHTSGLQLPRVGNMPSAAPRRYAGDGLDFRRPARPAREQEATSVDLSEEDEVDDEMHIDLGRTNDVIDLTADDPGYGASRVSNSGQAGIASEDGDARRANRRQVNGPRRLPRGMDIIIDLDNGDEEWRMGTPATVTPNSPDIEFISAREIDPPGQGHQRALGLSNSDGDEVEFVRANRLPDAEVERRRDQEMDRVLNLIGDMNGGFTHLRAQVQRFHAQIDRTAAGFRRAPVVPPRGARLRQQVQAGFEGPGMLDFDLVGFDMGMGPTRPPAPPPAPAYRAPPPAPDGLTRSPEEEGPLICPNCEEELCVGEDEVKRQVWIVKLCGHVYCGECTANRSAKKSSKGKEKPHRTKPFKECAVEGCDKKVSNAKAMIQVYL